MERSHHNDQKDYIEQIWEYILEKDLSFAVTDRDGNIVGICLNKDGQDQPKTMITNPFGIIVDFLDSIEIPFL